MSEAHRFMQFMPDAVEEISDDDDSPEFVANVTVMPTPHEDSWHGLWAFDADNGHEEVYGDRDEVIAWARERSPNVLVWSEALQDLEQLPA
jgi:hypothetical protein